MRKAYIQISYRLLEVFLKDFCGTATVEGIPEEFRVTSTFDNPHKLVDTFEVVIESPELHEVPEGGMLPKITPIYHTKVKDE